MAAIVPGDAGPEGRGGIGAVATVCGRVAAAAFVAAEFLLALEIK